MNETKYGLPVIRESGLICEPVMARKQKICDCSGEDILPRELYYSVTVAGSGLGGICHPDRVKTGYIQKYINKRKEGRKFYGK